MAWDKGGKYYTRSRRCSGRVTRQYVGAGAVGLLAAALDEARRAFRAEKAAAWRAEQARLGVLDQQVAALEQLSGLLARAALLAAGYHEHKRQWRRTRVRRNEDE
jgi:hypothetical protein